MSVLLDAGASPARINAVEEILERYHPVDVHVEQEEGGLTAAAGRREAKAGGPAAGEEQIRREAKGRWSSRKSSRRADPHKEAKRHTERVRGTVRRTNAEIEKE